MTATLRVLLADDYAGLLKTYRRLLEPPHQIIGCLTEGDAVVAAARSLRPDVIVLDFAMPGLNGIDATWQIKKALPRTSVIGFSVQSDPAIRRVMHDAGAATFLAKERATELPQVIASIIGKRPGDLA